MSIQVTSIFHGWINSIRFDNVKPELKEIFLKRLEICSGCPHMVEDTLYKRLPSSGNKQIESKKSYKCDLCGCRTVAKISSKSSRCPDKPARWGEIKERNGVVTDDGITPQKI